MDERDPGDDEVLEIGEGWDVVDASGAKAGAVRRVEPDHIVVARGLLFPTERVVPVDLIAGVAPGRVLLAVGRDALDDVAAVRAPETRAAAGLADDRVVSGAMQLAPPSIDAPLGPDSVRVEQRPLATEGAGAAFSEWTIAVPVLGELAEVRLRPRVYEQAEVVRGLRERQRVARDVLRREEVAVSGGVAAARGTGTGSALSDPIVARPDVVPLDAERTIER